MIEDSSKQTWHACKAVGTKCTAMQLLYIITARRLGSQCHAKGGLDDLFEAQKRGAECLLKMVSRGKALVAFSPWVFH